MENLRFPLLIALGACLFILFQNWQTDYAPTQVIAEAPISTTGETATEVPSTTRPASQDSGVPTASETVEASPSVSIAKNAGQLISIRTDLLNVEISTVGGDIRKLELVDYPIEMTAPEGAKRRLLNDGGQYYFIAQSGLVGSGATLPNHLAVFTANKTLYSLNEDDTLEVPLLWTGDNGISVVKTFVFTRGSYEVAVRQEVTNNGVADVKVNSYAQLIRNDFSATEPSGPFMQAFNGVAFHEQKEGEKYKYSKFKWDDIIEEKVELSQMGGWVAMVQHYFFGALIPASTDHHRFYGSYRESDNKYVGGFITDGVTVAPNQQTESTTRMFFGPKLQDIIDKVAPDLEYTTDYGFLTVLSAPMFWLLSKIYSFVGNWALAIILVTVLIKAVFFKLSEAQYRSMGKMRQFTPRIQQLRERYADDRAVLNQKMMELYKTEGFNPLGGCLPMLVQIPFFIALYWVLLESVELHQAPFMLWITDLSVKDPLYILPLLLGAVMFLQQKMNSATITDPVQRKVMMFMPVMMCAFFAFFPAGLVLYWLANTGLGMIQQWVITRAMDKAAEAK